MNDERRRFRRVSSGVTVGFRRDSVDDSASEYLQGVAENCGLGGMFIATSHTFPRGSVLSLDIQVGDQPLVEARAIVRWVNRWSRPQGMGVEFIEFEGLGDRDFEKWFAEAFEPE